MHESVIYPVVILILVFIFGLMRVLYIAGAGWAYLALGDSAANLVGRKCGHHRWKWSEEKTIEGTLAYVLFGSVGAYLLIRWIGSGERYYAAFNPVFTAFLAFSGAVLAAFLEILPLKFRDDIIPPLGGAFFIYILCLINTGVMAENFYFGNIVPGFILTAFTAYWMIRKRYVSKSTSGTILVTGVLISLFLGIQGALLINLFVLLLGRLARRCVETSGTTVNGRRSTGEEEENSKAVHGISSPVHSSAAIGYLIVPLFFAFMAFSSSVRPSGNPLSSGFYLLFAAAFTGSLGAIVSGIASIVYGPCEGRRVYSIMTFAPEESEKPGTLTREGFVAGVLLSILLAVCAWIVRMIPLSLAPIIVVGSIAAYVARLYFEAIFQKRYSTGDRTVCIISSLAGGIITIIMYLLNYIKVSL
jgi:uncharacterized membrane protein